MDHQDTDIVGTAGEVVPNKQQLYTLPTSEIIKRKTKLVAWVVSNCKAPSLRSEYVKELAKHIAVDVFGKCGNHSCPLSNCFSTIEKQYKFYLAFENSYCNDYLTEKLYRTLALDIVPIVLGAANYSNIVPGDSVIDVRDLKSPRHLADYLKKLDKHDEAYLKYFKWKKYYTVNSGLKTRPKGICKLCEILHSRQYNYKTDFNPEDYWNGERLCKRGEILKDILHIGRLETKNVMT
jgi:hypothetical protein